MLRAFGLAAEEKTDINKEKFNPNNASHCLHIDNRLADFSAKRDALMAFDKKMSGAMGLTTLVWLSGFTGGWGPYLAIPAYIAIYFTAKEHYGRNQLQQQFDASLKELYEIYQWYGKGQPAMISFKERYLNLLEALIPFTLQWEDLLLWDLKTTNPNEISDRFVEIFAKSPHRVNIVLNRQPQQASWFGSILGGTAANPLPAAVPNPEAWLQQTRPYQFFARSAANVKLNWYGKNFEDISHKTLAPGKG